MSWIDERIAERKKVSTDNYHIGQASNSSFEDLWNELMANVEAYRKEYGKESVITGGYANERYISVPRLVSHELPQKITLAQVKANAIKAGDLTFVLNVCDHGVVRLTLNGEQLTVGDAARRVLDPLLFPDLQSGKKY